YVTVHKLRDTPPLPEYRASCSALEAPQRQEGACKVTDERVEKTGVTSRDKYDAAIRRARDLLQRAKDECGAPGIVAAVSVDCQLVWAEGLGYCDVENRIPCGPQHVMRIASISKSLTMTAVAKLWEEGKLDLDKPVQDYVPSFPEKEWEGEKVTMTTRHLLSHLGGIRHYDKSYLKKKDKKEENPSEKDKDKNKNASNTKMENVSVEKGDKPKSEKGDKPKSEKVDKKQNVPDSSFEEMVSKREFKSIRKSLDLFKDDPLVHKPGSKYLYTTHGWTLISAVVEAASGKDFLAYMQTLLTEMDLKETVPDKPIPIIYHRARGYQFNKKGRLENTPYVDLSYKWAGGGYLSTVGDLIKFGNAMLYSYQKSPEDKENLPGLLKQSTMQTIWKPVPNAKSKPSNESCYAMGWAVVEREQKHGQCRPRRHFVSHSGGAMGFSSLMAIVPCPEDGVGEKCEANSVSNDPVELDGNQKELSKSALNGLPRGIVVAAVVNLTDVGLSKPVQEIGEVFGKAAYS
ncbi:serine beta-lactamase-like protein LACTB, mitochondrial, partial [Diadema antillarum]|uniref:serine beta-lactamase-like protein LACTB, mitochondrial n=1 Tax=Diadema antillarum TaxID=105358 RepID=UPI003A88D1A0